MNSLSWMLYLADVVGGLGILTGVLGIGIVLIAGIGFLVAMDDNDTRLMKRLGAALGVGIASFFVCVLTPSKETVYAIAASEMGEELLKTPTAAKATKALDAWLDKQIADNTKKVSTDD